MKSFLPLRYIAVLLLLFCFCNLLKAQVVLVTGLLISDESARPLPLANILNKTTLKRSLTNRQGYFNIHVAAGDTIVFTSVGFDPLLVTGTQLIDAKSDTVMLLMHAGSYRLRDVTIVYSNRRRDSIARAVAAILKTDTLLNNNQRILNRPRGCVTTDGGLGYSGALTELYYQFSKEGKDMVHFEQFVSYYEEVRMADAKYNKEVITHITGLPYENLDDFILFCKLNRQFIIQAQEYDLIKAIKDCETRFRKEKNLPKQADNR